MLIPDQAVKNRQVPDIDSSVYGSIPVVILHVEDILGHPAAGIFNNSVCLRLNCGVEESPSPGVSQGGAVGTLVQHGPHCVEAVGQRGDMYRVQSLSVRLVRCACVGI